MASKRRTRLCSLCHQFYGSGFRDNVAASDILRARRMLLERGSGGNNDAEIRQGLELFLDELTKQRELEGNQHQPLDICVFCVQFLPAAYQEDKLIDDFRSQVLLGSARGASHGAHHPSRNHHHQQPVGRPASKRAYGSSLVIQHQFVKPTPPSQALSPRPRSSIGSFSPSSSSSSSSPSTIASANHPHYSHSHPAAKSSYRLLTNDITRVLRIESPRGGQLSSSIGAEGDKLMASEVMQNLQSQEKQQTVAILRSMRAKQDAKLRQKLFSIELQAALSSASRPENIVHTIRATGAADSLYTGVVLSSSHSTNLGGSGTRQRQRAPKTAIASQSQIKTQKSGRHFKTELFFPPV